MKLLEVIELILKDKGRPMSSREIAFYVKEESEHLQSGKTPWKTANARLSEDIVNFAEKSKFLRTNQGKFGLREWKDVQEYHSPRRKLNPVDEIIKVISTDQLKKLETRQMLDGVYDIDVRRLLLQSEEMVRLEAEKSINFVQLIPTFLVRKKDTILTYNRTKRLPESRLHNQRSISFGGHMQTDDVPMLFFSDDEVLKRFLHRELYEELSFDPPPKSIEFLGMIHLLGNDFERQHAGLVYDVVICENSEIDSLEPGMHSDLRFEKIHSLQSRREVLDSWSVKLLEMIGD